MQKQGQRGVTMQRYEIKLKLARKGTENLAESIKCFIFAVKDTENDEYTAQLHPRQTR